MPAREVWEVLPQPDGWAVRREGASEADSVHDRQDEAIARGVDLARRARGELRVKGRDGRIRDERTYTNDPFPPPG